MCTGPFLPVYVKEGRKAGKNGSVVIIMVVVVVVVMMVVVVAVREDGWRQEARGVCGCEGVKRKREICRRHAGEKSWRKVKGGK
jgi:hypothetical protein